MGERAKVRLRAPATSVAGRIDRLREMQGISRWQLWRGMQKAGYKEGRLTVYRALGGKTKPSASLVATAAIVLRVEADALLFGPPGAGLLGAIDRYLTLVVGDQAEAEGIHQRAQDRRFQDALTVTLRGVLPKPARGLLQRYASQASTGVFLLLKKGPGAGGLLLNRMNALVGFARAAFVMDLAETEEEFGRLVRSAAAHLIEAEGRWRTSLPKEHRGRGDLAEVNREWQTSYQRFAAAALGALLVRG